MRKKAYLLTAVLVAAFLLVGTTYGSAMELTATHVLGPDHHYQHGFEVMRDIIEEETDGEITMEIFDSAALYEEGEALEALQAGVVDLTTVSAAPVTGFVSEFMAIDLPFLFADSQEAYDFYDGEMGDALFEKTEEVGLVGLAWWENGMRHLTNNERPITGPEDLEGLAIRTMDSPPHMETMEVLGASATPVDFGELYSALEAGTVDGQENPVANIYDMSFYEVQDYLTISGHFYDPSPTFISPHTWEDLTSEQQDIVVEAAEVARDEMRQLALDREEDQLEEMEDEIEIYELSEEEIEEFQDATAEVAYEFTDEIGEEFLEEFLEAAGL